MRDHVKNSFRRTHFATILLALVLALVGPTTSALLGDLRGEAEPAAASSLNGSQLWASRQAGAGTDWGHALAVHPDGLLVFATGESFGQATGADFMTIAYEPLTGTRVWTATYNGPAYARDAAYGIAVSPDGRTVYVGGVSRGATGSGIAVVAYNALTGLELWVAREDGVGSGPDQKAALALSPDGSRVYLTGPTGSWSTSRYTTLAVDAATGSPLWVSTYTGTSGGDEPQDVAVSPDGSTVFVTGWTHVSGFSRYLYATVAYDATTGAQLWAMQLDGPAQSMGFARALDLSPDGSLVYVTGGSVGVGNFDIATVAYDTATGAEAWTAWYNGPQSNSDSAYDLEVSPDGSQVFVTGFSWGVGSSLDYVTIAYDATTGSQLWVGRFNGPQNAAEFATALAVSPDGMRVYVTGYTLHSNVFHYGTIAYDTATGAQEWVARYNDAGNSFADAIAVDPLGLRVYVTGGSDGMGTGRDFATVAYLDIR
jgi:DNA-binding beta-propeller fold protein YncE